MSRLLLCETGAPYHWELLDDSVECTSKLRASPGNSNSPTFPACPCSSRKLGLREIIDFWDRKPLMCGNSQCQRIISRTSRASTTLLNWTEETPGLLVTLGISVGIEHT